MRGIFVIVVILLASRLSAQTKLVCGANTLEIKGSLLSSVKFVGSDKKSNIVTTFYTLLDNTTLTVWEETAENGEIQSVVVYTINKTGISNTAKSKPYLDEIKMSDYEKPLKRIYISCADRSACIKSSTYLSWSAEGKPDLSENVFLQIDGTDKNIHQQFLNSLLNWLNN